MNVAWKFAAVLALLLSLSALYLEILDIQSRRSAGTVQQEVARQLAQREQALVERVAPRINQIRTDVGLPTRRLESLEDVFHAMTESIEAISAGKIKESM